MGIVLLCFRGECELLGVHVSLKDASLGSGLPECR